MKDGLPHFDFENQKPENFETKTEKTWFSQFL